jgi:hypothetical protein
MLPGWKCAVTVGQYAVGAFVEGERFEHLDGISPVVAIQS